MSVWPEERATALMEKFAAIDAKPVARWTWLPSIETNFIRYFSESQGEDFQRFPGLEYVEYQPDMDLSEVDIALRFAHGGDLSGEIFRLKQRFPHLIVATWMWDNHTAYANNLKTAMAADINFPSHNYVASYLINPSAPVGAHVPLCCAQWTLREASEAARAGFDNTRSDKMLVNYVDYPWSWRSGVLRNLKENLPEAETLLMPPGDRTRYFSMSRPERLKEWLDYKSTLILPVDRDLSTRIFDALLAGMVVVVPTMIADFDAVIPADEQKRLGVVRVNDFELPTLREAALTAARTFDEMGSAGVKARYQYVIEGHMMAHRFNLILRTVRSIGTPRPRVQFNMGPNGPVGLLWAPAARSGEATGVLEAASS